MSEPAAQPEIASSIHTPGFYISPMGLGLGAAGQGTGSGDESISPHPPAPT